MVRLREPRFRIELSDATTRTSSTAKDLVLKAIDSAVWLDYRKAVWQMTELPVREATWGGVWQATEMAVADAIGEAWRKV